MADVLEYRIDAVDGCPYTLEDFIEEYGGSTEQPPQQWLQSKLASKEEVAAALQQAEVEADAEAEAEGDDSDEDGDDEAENGQPPRQPPPSWLPFFDLEGEPLAALSGIVDAMSMFGVAIDEDTVGPETLGIPPQSQFARTLAEVRKVLLHGEGLALLRGIPVPEESKICRVLLMALVSGLGFRAIPQTGNAADIISESQAVHCHRVLESATCEVLATLCASTTSGLTSPVSVRLLDAQTLHKTIAAERPDCYARLCQSWSADSFGRGEILSQVPEQPVLKQLKKDQEQRPIFWGGSGGSPHCVRYNQACRHSIPALLAQCGPATLAATLRALAQAARTEGPESWDRHFGRVLILVLDSLAHVDAVGVRDAALLCLQELVTHVPTLFKDFAEVVASKLFDTYESIDDSVKPAAASVDRTLERLMSVVEPARALEIVLPLLQCDSSQQMLAAIKLLAPVLQRMSADVVLQHLETVLPGVVQAFGHMCSEVRKTAVFCLVDVYMILGEQVMPYYVKDLTPSQMKLVTIYIGRQQRERDELQFDDRLPDRRVGCSEVSHVGFG